MLLTLNKFGGIMPLVLDPTFLPDGKSQTAIDCRFDQGGLTALPVDVTQETPSRSGTKVSIFRYYEIAGATEYFFTWLTDVDAVTAPLPNDSWERVFYTEAGALKVTDKNLFNQGGTAYPMAFLYPSPPAPLTPPIAYCPSVVGSPPTDEETRAYIFTYVNIYGEEGPPSDPSALINLFDGNEVDISGLGPPTGTYTMPFTQGQADPTAAYQFGSGRWFYNEAKTAAAYALSVTVSSGSFHDLNAAGVITFMAWNGQTFNSGANPRWLNRVYGAGLVWPLMYSTAEPTPMSSVDYTAYALTNQRIYRLNQTSTGTAQYQFVAEVGINTTTFVDNIYNADLSEVLVSLEWDGAPTGIKGLIALPNGFLAGFVDNLLCLSVVNYPHAWPVSYQKPTDRPIIALGAYGTTIVVVTEGQPYLAVGNDPSNIVMEKMDIGFSCMSKRGLIQAGDIIAYPSPEGLVVIGPQTFAVVTKPLMTMQQWQANYYPTTISAYYWEGKYVGFYNGGGGHQAGFIYDFKTGEFIDIDLYATAGFHDKTDGRLYLQVGNNIVKFCDSASSYRTYTYITKRFKYRKTAFTCGKVLAQSYPVYLSIIYPELSYTYAVTVANDTPFRLPTILSEAMDIEITGTAPVYAVFVAGAIEEIPV
jgi:hypothetical protein